MIQAAGLGIQGRNLFIGTIPGDVPEAIMVRPPLNSAKIDEGMGGHIDETILIIVRDPDALKSYNKALTVAKVLKRQHVQVGDIYFTWIRPESMPASYPRGDGDGIETSVYVQLGWSDVSQSG